jgi:Chaperone of endosialidase
MADVTKRMNYFDRQFLRAADFTAEQAYDLDRRRRHNRLLHAPGIAEGLQVSANINDAFVTVAAGTAYDALGQEIVLASSQQVDISAIAGSMAYIAIAYGEQGSDPSTDPGMTGTSTRISEQPALAATATPPGNPNLTLPLATVALASGKVSAAPDNAVRNQAGAVLGQDLTVHSVTLRNDTVAVSTWPKLVCSAANTAALQNAGLSMDNSQEIFFADNGQVRSHDDSHRLVFNRQNNLMELHELGDITFITGSTPAEKMRVTASGKVGIGTATPDVNLSVQGSTGATYLKVHDSATANNGPFEILLGVDSNGGIVSTMTNHDLQLRSGASNTHMILKADGKVGIGTTTPGFLLDVNDRIRLRQGANGTAGLWLYQTAKPDQAFLGMASDTLVGLWGSAIPGVIVGPPVVAAPVVGPVASAPVVSAPVVSAPVVSAPVVGAPVVGAPVVGAPGAVFITGAWGLVMDTATGNVAIGLGATSTTLGKLDVGGNVHASGFPTSSDERFKTNITPIGDALEKVEGIRGVVFDWNELYESLGRSTGRREIGIIAQDVEKVCPELVSTWHEEEYKAVDYGRLTAVLVEAIKELKAKNESLEQRIEALEESRGAPQKESELAAAKQRSRSKRSSRTEPQDS